MDRDSLGSRSYTRELFVNGLNTYLFEAQKCVEYDLGYPAILLIGSILDTLASKNSHTMDSLISQMIGLDWFISDRKDDTGDLVSEFIRGCQSVAFDFSGPDKTIMIRDRTKIIDGQKLPPPGIHIIVLDEFLAEVKKLSERLVGNDLN